MVPVEFCCVCWVNPVDETVIGWLLAWPATKPISSSPDAAGVIAPLLAAVPVLDAPTEVSSAFVAAMPENSWTERAIVAAVAACAVIVVAAAALAAYHRSP